MLAIVLGEPYDPATLAALDGALISTVNAAEVFGRAARDGIDLAIPAAFFATSGVQVVPLSLAQAECSGQILPTTRAAGLSLGDRCCIALALELGADILTADRAWLDFAAALGVTIRLIR